MDDGDRPDDAGEAEVQAVVNTHVHLPPNFSAFATPEQAVQAAADEGVTVLGTANYYDFHVYRRFAEAARADGVLPLFGTEIITVASDGPAAEMLVNDPSNPGRLYLCGKGLSRFDPAVPAAAQRMEAIRSATDARLRAMTALLAERFEQAGLRHRLTDGEIVTAVAERCGVPAAWVSLQERHVAQAFQEALFGEVPPDGRGAILERLWPGGSSTDASDVVAVQEAIRSNLMKAGRPAFVAEAAVSFDDGYRLVLDLGGIPCYPILADGASPVCAFEDPPEALAERLLERRIYCAELIPVRNRREVVDRYVDVLRGAGLIVLAGTEHNTQRMIPVGPAARGGEPLSERSREVFWEATCVVAAHQALRSAGRPGYVDGEGGLAGAFEDCEARIRSLRAVGAGLIAARPRMAATARE